MNRENAELKLNLIDTQTRLLEAQLHLLGYQRREAVATLEGMKAAESAQPGQDAP